MCHRIKRRVIIWQSLEIKSPQATVQSSQCTIVSGHNQETSVKWQVLKTNNKYELHLFLTNTSPPRCSLFFPMRQEENNVWNTITSIHYKFIIQLTIWAVVYHSQYPSPYWTVISRTVVAYQHHFCFILYIWCSADYQNHKLVEITKIDPMEDAWRQCIHCHSTFTQISTTHKVIMRHYDRDRTPFELHITNQTRFRVFVIRNIMWYV
jgi:hypothetical protein